MLTKLATICLMSVLTGGIALAAAPQQQVAPIDQIIVLVNDDVITRHELNERQAMTARQLTKQGTALPEPEVLEKQVLERMIIEMLQAQFAKETGVRIDDSQLDRTLQRIAQSNNIDTLEEFRLRVQQDGMDYTRFREDIRAEMAVTRLREREVDNKIVISDSEIDNFLTNQAQSGDKGDEYRLAHIFVGIPEQASAALIHTSQQLAEEALARLRGGDKFAEVAAAYSNAKDAMTGGDLGWRTAERISPLFLEELRKLKPGETTGIMRSPNGFHILKLVDKRSKDKTIVITQTHARHIIIRTSELVPEKDAREKLFEIKRTLDKGGDFAEQARLSSQDGSASQGGDLGWLSPGDTVPEFESAMNSAPIGQVVGPIQTGFGFHLVQVLERRNQDVSAEQKRNQARQSIRALKSDEAYQDWLRQLRDRAFIEYRIEQSN